MAKLVTILTQQRCKSAWLANFLDYPPVSAAIHEPSWNTEVPLANWRAAARRHPAHWVFLVDPIAAGFRLKEWLDAFADCPLGVIRRPIIESLTSMTRAFSGRDHATMVREAHEVGVAIWDLSERPEIPVIEAKDVTAPNGEPLREFLAKLVPGLPFPQTRFHRLRGLRCTVIPSIRYGE